MKINGLIVQKMYCAIRKGDGEEFFDQSTLFCNPENSKRAAEENDNSLPSYFRHNKVVRIAAVILQEVKE